MFRVAPSAPRPAITALAAMSLALLAESTHRWAVVDCVAAREVADGRAVNDHANGVRVVWIARLGNQSGDALMPYALGAVAAACRPYCGLVARLSNDLDGLATFQEDGVDRVGTPS